MSAESKKANYLIQNEKELIITKFLQKNEPLTRARAIEQQIATPNAELLKTNAGSPNQRIAKSKESSQLSTKNTLDKSNITELCVILLKRAVCRNKENRHK